MVSFRIIIICVLFSTLFAINPLWSAEKSSAYKKTLKAWTRSDKVYITDNFKEAIGWNATLLNDAMLMAQANYYAKVYEISADEKQKKLDELKKKKGDEVLVFVSFFSGDRHFDDLTDERAKWDVRLEAGGVTFRPTRIEKISKRANPLDMLYFPYLNNWSRGYYFWFSPQAQLYSKPWTLSVHGPEAKSKLVWK